MGTDDIHSRILMIFLTGTAYPHEYCRYASRSLMISLIGTEYHQGTDGLYWVSLKHFGHNIRDNNLTMDKSKNKASTN